MLKSIIVNYRICVKILFSFFILFAIGSSAGANILVLNGLTHENASNQGETYRDRIEIQNNGTDKKSVRIYLRDYWFSYTGESTHDSPGTLERSNAAWINYSPQLITLEANEKVFIDFEVNVPQDDSLKGTYWSVIMVEGITTPDTTPSTGGVKINTAIRYAIQVITTIGDTGKKDLQFLGLELVKDNDVGVLNVAVENIGECILKPEMSLEVFDASGNSLGIFKADRRKTFPGTSIKSSLVLEGIKPGNYTGILVADCDEDHIYGTNISLEI
ncbi:hypothetical protein [Draconibacterium halophilum]|uniref:DUF3324 domain-containing protein n=1 Tax=Draconibacterium halophilum TaxID=2706887 RepID=A0A6C0RJI5_9BACT|nr:hypothetical protein [Draconibacterium halophilum]QIA09785.1 hypothetical protein G0Q07_19670 [Draconibacterium halophilum]